MRQPQRKRWNAVLKLLVLAIFVLWGYHQYAGGSDSGDDLASSYVGSRLVSSGQALGHLYQHDPHDFSAIGADEAWQAAADAGGFSGYLHPYVQTPMWAYLLEPACTRVTFLRFKQMFAVLLLMSFALTVALIARFWAPALDTPHGLALVLLLLAMSVPFGYAMFLMQTHVLFFAMTVSGLMLAERGRPGMAGFLLAFAAAVKVTPGLILVYWLVRRRWKAAAAMTGWMAGLTGLTVLLGGWPLFRLYLAELSRVGHVLLLSENNQSLAAWWMARFYSPDEALDIAIYRLPEAVRLVSAGLMIGVTLLGAMLDRRAEERGEALGIQLGMPSGMPSGVLFGMPVGAVMAMLAATLFAPIAWTHYSILLLAPAMLFAQTAVRWRSWPMALLLVVVIALNLPPLAADVTGGEIGRYALVRGQFFAGVLCLTGLAWMGFRRVQTEDSRRKGVYVTRGTPWP